MEFSWLDKYLLYWGCFLCISTCLRNAKLLFCSSKFLSFFNLLVYPIIGTYPFLRVELLEFLHGASCKCLLSYVLSINLSNRQDAFLSGCSSEHEIPIMLKQNFLKYLRGAILKVLPYLISKYFSKFMLILKNISIPF